MSWTFQKFETMFFVLPSFSIAELRLTSLKGEVIRIGWAFQLTWLIWEVGLEWVKPVQSGEGRWEMGDRE